MTMKTKKPVKTNSIVKEKKSKGGRPKLKLCEQDITNLARIGCSVEDMALVLNCSTRTIERRFVGACEKGRADLRNNIKKTQVDVAINDRSVPMLIWLGKQLLGQKDSRQEVEHKGEIPLIIKHFGTKEPRQWKEKKKNEALSSVQVK